ncbi:hypothetical protein X975_15236, partial [Stegodyphus mimosarum]
MTECICMCEVVSPKLCHAAKLLVENEMRHTVFVSKYVVPV